jgi:hypothetical protein
MKAPENKDVDGALITSGTAKLKRAVNRWVNGIFGTLDLMESGRWICWQLVIDHKAI